MPIEKHFFAQTSTEANVTEVIAWLTENATEYFDTFEKKFGDVSNTSAIRMNTNSGAYVSINVDTSPGYSCVDVKLNKNSTNGSVASPYTFEKYISYAIKTSYGIALIGLSNNLRVFITKSNLGATAVYAMCKSYKDSTSSESMQFVAGDLENSLSFQKTPSIHSSSETANLINQGYYVWQNNGTSDLTVLAPFVFKSNSYAEHMFITPFSQYPRTICQINLNGKNYFYDGYVALEE